MSKKEKIKKKLVEQILGKAEIPYESLIFNALEDADSLPKGLVKSDIYKTLALVGDKTGPLIGVLPITAHLAEKKLAAASGNKKVSMIPQKVLQKTTGYVHGANNPVGIHQTKAFPIYFDKAAENRAFIVVSAGEVGRSVKVNPRQLAEFVAASFTDLSE
ncbi:MAG: aminoacyl-tRNA deacylase [Streptococcaceae bacterium]|jgi:Cys-tRNA(Pro)/Cys-tRNA(Cys) deacylase|nr:aminoacyl-tRNA deacylase [Streptococcaceae bacterium]